MIREILNWFSEKHETNALTEQEIMNLLSQDLPE